MRRAGGVAISSPCPIWEWSFSSVLFLKLCFFFLLPLVILETLFCGRKQFRVAVLPQDKYWSLTIMQQPSPWDAFSVDRLTTQDRSRRNRFNQMAWQNQAQYSFQIFDDQLGNWSTIQLPRNGTKCKCKLLKSCQAQMQAPRPGERVVQDNALKPWGRLWLECLNYHKMVISNEVGVFCQWHEKVWKIKKVDERFVMSHQHKT